MVRCRHGIFLIWQDCKYLGHFLVRHKLHPIARNTGNTSIETKSTSNEERLEKTIHGRKDIARRKERRQSRRDTDGPGWTHSYLMKIDKDIAERCMKNIDKDDAERCLGFILLLNNVSCLSDLTHGIAILPVSIPFSTGLP